MLTVCFGIQAVGMLINIFAAPGNGHIFYTVYYTMHAIAMAGINSGTVNLIYDYVSHEKRTAALALNGAISGLTGFLVTIVAAKIMYAIQFDGNTLCGFTMYAPQLLSVISFLVTCGILIYFRHVICRRRCPSTESDE